MNEKHLFSKLNLKSSAILDFTGLVSQVYCINYQHFESAFFFIKKTRKVHILYKSFKCKIINNNNNHHHSYNVCQSASISWDIILHINICDSTVIREIPQKTVFANHSDWYCQENERQIRRSPSLFVFIITH